MSEMFFYDKNVLPKLCGEFAVIDSEVDRLYGDNFDFSHKLTLSLDEKTKSLESVERICNFLLENGANRDSNVYAIGGGVLTDTVGFAAAVYMRGIDWTVVPTTLLAFADSAIGGKTGVNFKAKNILGSFHLPKIIYFFGNFLLTLDVSQIESGIGEIVKTSLLDRSVNEFIQNNLSEIASHNIDLLIKAAALCAEYKAEICEKDLYDVSLRNRLNLGHTIGHAIEYCCGLSHGESVLWGIKIESELFRKYIKPEFFERIEQTVGAFLKDKSLPDFKVERFLSVLSSDKKNNDGKVVFIIAKEVGKTEKVSVDKKDLEKMIYAYLRD